MRFAHTIGKINAVILLTVFYLVIIGVIALAKRSVSMFQPHHKGWIKKESLDPTMDWASHQY